MEERGEKKGICYGGLYKEPDSIGDKPQYVNLPSKGFYFHISYVFCNKNKLIKILHMASLYYRSLIYTQWLIVHV